MFKGSTRVCEIDKEEERKGAAVQVIGWPNLDPTPPSSTLFSHSLFPHYTHTSKTLTPSYLLMTSLTVTGNGFGPKKVKNPDPHLSFSCCVDRQWRKAMFSFFLSLFLTLVALIFVFGCCFHLFIFYYCGLYWLFCVGSLFWKGKEERIFWKGKLVPFVVCFVGDGDDDEL